MTRHLARLVRRFPLSFAALYIAGVLMTWSFDAQLDRARLERGVSRAIATDAVATHPVLPDHSTGVKPRLPYYVHDFGPRDAVPVVMLHGTPGGSGVFFPLARAMEERGRRAIFLDLPGVMSQTIVETPGWPNVQESFSAQAFSDVVLAILRGMGIQRAHVVGWSNGGAVALHMAHADPSRIASVTLLASVGAQETEGSGNYHFEHAKYALGWATIFAGAKLVPHMGLLGAPSWRHAFIRTFMDTDQRPLAEIMRTTPVPTLILHGRDDFLVADWAAEYHHDLMPSSTLIMTPYDHFLPFNHPDLAANWIDNYITRFDTPGVPPVRETIDLAPRRTPFGSLGETVLRWIRLGPTGLVALAFTLLAFAFRRLGPAWIALLVGATELDIALGWATLSAAMIASLLLRGDVRSMPAWLRALGRPGLVVGAGFFLTQLALRPLGLALGEAGWILAVLILSLAIEVGLRPFSREGRLSLRVQWQRLRNHEWWPTWAIHGAALPAFVLAAIRSRHPIVFTCCNPGIEAGGGFAGESKAAILAGLGRVGGETLLHCALVPAGPLPAERAEHALRQIAVRPELGGYPIILKPDRGEHGKGLRLCRGESDVLAFFEGFPGDAIAQRYHPGPMEAGIFWVRTPGAEGPLAGRVFSVTRKVFPELTCDGKRTLAQLIDAHPRYRIQRRIFRQRFAHRLAEVPEAGTVIRLSPAGNHAQGALFLDAPELLTPELEAAIDRLANGFRGVGGGELDIGRFDVRFATEDDLKAGQNFGIVEVNGVTGESLNIYDPTKPVTFAWRTIAAQWKIACELGAWRMNQGAKPLSVYQIIFGTRRHLRSRKTYAPAS